MKSAFARSLTLLITASLAAASALAAAPLETLPSGVKVMHTVDGTGVRDYLHVTDLAEGHVAAVRTLLGETGNFTVNLGTGGGTSVLGMVRAFERASGRKIPFEFAPRRPGDVAQCFADVSLAASLLDWRATRNIEDMCRDSWRWQQSNPHGYQTALALA